MKSWFKKQMAVLLTLVLAFSVTIPVSAEGIDESVQTVTVTLSGQAGGAFLFTPGEYTISSNEAEKFGYKDAEGGVTILDALVYAHELTFGEEDFTKERDNYLQINEKGWINKMFGDDSGAFSYTVNADFANGLSDLVKDNDNICFWIYQDQTSWTDQSVWIEQGESKVFSLKMEENTSQNLALKFYAGGRANAQITLIPKGESVGESIAVTDENGNATLTDLKTGEYYLSATVDANPPIVMPLCKLQVIPNIKYNIAATYTDTMDPWKIVEMVAYGQQDKLENKDTYVESAKKTISENAKSTETEKAIIALSGLGYDVSNLDIDGEKVNAISKLFEKEINATNVCIFALNAVDSGKYTIPSDADNSREQLVKDLLNLQTADKGWAYVEGSLPEGKTQETDMTAMALTALAPYYLADNAEEAELTETTYKNVKTAVDAAVNTLSAEQSNKGTYGNVFTDAMVIVALSSLGIDANKDSRFVKDGNGLYDGMLQYMTADYSGFWADSKTKEVYDPATEQAFRALVAYSKMKESGKPYNVYMFGALDPSVSRVKLNVSSKEMTIGDTFTLQTQVLPEIATNKEVTYETSDATVAEVSEKGVVTAKKAGTATIKVISKEDNTRTATCEIVAKDKKVEPTPNPGDKKDDKTEATTEATTETTTEAPAKVNYSKIPLQTGKKTNVIQINGGKTKIKKATVSNKKIVSVTVKNGKLQIKAKKKGKAVISITDENGKVSKVTVEVKKSVPLKKLSLNKKKVTLKVNQKEKLVVTKNPVTAVTKLKWSTSDKKIATVDQNGKVKAKKKGKVTITVKASNGKKARCKVTVK